jgi:hypothetical protein
MKQFSMASLGNFSAVLDMVGNFDIWRDVNSFFQGRQSYSNSDRARYTLKT